jgi:hypothetical protein
MQEYISIYKDYEANKRLLYLGEHGEMKKRQGRKGDTGVGVSHQEL